MTFTESSIAMPSCQKPVVRAARSGWRRNIAGLAGLVLASLTGVASAAANQPLNVVVTIKPVHALVTAVMEGVGTPSVLISGTASPHVFALKPSEARALAKADVVFRVSAALEPFTVKLAQSLPRSVQLVSLADATGVVSLARRTGNGFERHDHGHAEGHAGHHRDDGDTSIDPHVWLDPANARAMARAIVATLSARAPAHAQRFAENGQRLDDSLSALDSELAAQLGPISKRPLIVFHDAYQYLEHRYGLTVVGAITINPEVAPSAKRLSELRARIARDGAACVLFEPQFSSRIVAAVTEGSGARTALVDPVGGAFDPGPRQYHQTLRTIADAITRCLATG